MKYTPKSWSASLPRSTARRALGRIVATPPVLLRRARRRSFSDLYTTTPFDSDNFATDSASLLQLLTTDDDPKLTFSSSTSTSSTSTNDVTTANRTLSALNPVFLNSRWSTGSLVALSVIVCVFVGPVKQQQLASLSSIRFFQNVSPTIRSRNVD
jgi:hypothetical protein